MLGKFIFSLALLSLLAPVFGSSTSRAEESTIDKIKDDAGDAKVDTKKAARKVARKTRKATGNDNAVKDAKDKVNDVGDGLSNDIDKTERKN